MSQSLFEFNKIFDFLATAAKEAMILILLKKKCHKCIGALVFVKMAMVMARMAMEVVTNVVVTTTDDNSNSGSCDRCSNGYSGSCCYDNMM